MGEVSERLFSCPGSPRSGYGDILTLRRDSRISVSVARPLPALLGELWEGPLRCGILSHSLRRLTDATRSRLSAAVHGPTQVHEHLSYPLYKSTASEHPRTHRIVLEGTEFTSELPDTKTTGGENAPPPHTRTGQASTAPLFCVREMVLFHVPVCPSITQCVGVIPFCYCLFHLSLSLCVCLLLSLICRVPI